MPLKEMVSPLALATCLLLAGCGPSGAVPNSAPSPSGPTAAGSTVEPWQAEWDRTVAAARQEGKVVVIGVPGDLLRKSMVEGFRKAFPDIALEWAGLRPAVGAAQVEAERRAGIYSVDVFNFGTTTGVTQMKPIGALEPLRPALILPEVTDPSRWLDNRLDFADRDEQILAFVSIAKRNLIYHPSQVKSEDLDELYELLDPRWRGRIALNDPIPTGAGQSSMRFFWEVLGPERATQFIRDLKEQAGAVDRDERRLVEWIARGRFPILLGPSDSLTSQLKQEGMQFGSIVEFRDYGTAISVSGGAVSLMNQAPHPNAARVFINWLLGKDGQTAFSTALLQASRRLDVPTDHLEPETLAKPGRKYWQSYLEEYQTQPPELASLLRDTFGR
jgi:iron(III) transport system substrate-binding protein